MIYPQIQRQRRKVEKRINRAMRLAEEGRLGTARIEFNSAAVELEAITALIDARLAGEVRHDN
ncbi:hypothetical protein ACIF2R_01570 [Serratia marcescens]|uniref:hypothetical protein n=1 Tax=Serratia marcescens TaxID=615 RepID=UPI0037CE183C